jgi:hypothetical protein
MVRLDQGQAQVDAGRHPGRRPELAFVDENAVFFHAQLRVGALQVAGELPVRRHALAVQHTGFGEQEGARANAADAARMFTGAAHDVEQAQGRQAPGLGLGLARDQESVDIVQRCRHRQYADAGRTGDDATVFRQHDHFIGRLGALGIGELEDRCCH